MSRTARTARAAAVACGLLLAAGVAPAGPLVQTGPYDVNLPDGSKYQVSGKVEAGGVGYVYTYTVKNLNPFTFTQDLGVQIRFFELAIAQDALHAGLHDETNPSVISGPGQLLADGSPAPSAHNYLWSFLQQDKRFGIPILGGQTQLMSFEDPRAPSMADWSFRQVSPAETVVGNAPLGLGQLPVPGGDIQRAPEPSTLTLSALGIAGAGLLFRRRRPRPAHPGQPA